MPDVQQAATTERRYPSKTVREARRLLSARYPVWLLSPEGNVIAANLLACWLWGRLERDPDSVRVHNVLGENVLAIVASNLRSGRIPYERNRSLLRAKFAVNTRMLRWFGPRPPYAAFEDAVLTQPFGRLVAEQVRAELAATGADILAGEWEYTLRIHRPDDANAPLLEFDTIVSEVYRGDDLAGFVAEYNTTYASTLPVLVAAYDMLTVAYDATTYVELQGGDPTTSSKEDDHVAGRGAVPFAGEHIIKRMQPSAPIPDEPITVVYVPAEDKIQPSIPLPDHHRPGGVPKDLSGILFQSERTRPNDTAPEDTSDPIHH